MAGNNKKDNLWNQWYSWQSQFNTPAGIATGNAVFTTFRQKQEPLSPLIISKRIGFPLEEIREHLLFAAGKGHATLNESGLVTGYAGLSVVPTQYSFSWNNKELWFWCAWDALSIISLFEFSGTLKGPLSSGIENIELEFSEGNITTENESLRLLVVPPEIESSMCDGTCSRISLYRVPLPQMSVDHIWLTVPEAIEWGKILWQPLKSGQH